MNDDAAGLGESPALTDFLGFTNRASRQGNRSNSSSGIPIAQVQHPGYGLTTDQLADAQRRFTTYARMRMQGTGHRDYSYGNKQAFEDMGIHRLIDELRDEIADAVNYLAFLDIQLSRWKQRMEETA